MWFAIPNSGWCNFPIKASGALPSLTTMAFRGTLKVLVFGFAVRSFSANRPQHLETSGCLQIDR